jgi:hypothetical protein
VIGPHPGHRTHACPNPGNPHAFDHPDPECASTGCERHRDVGRVHPTVAGDVEAGEHVVDPGKWKRLGHLRRGDLGDIHAAVTVEGSDSPILLEPVGVGGEFDESDRGESGGEAGLRLETGIEISRVSAELG